MTGISITTGGTHGLRNAVAAVALAAAVALGAGIGQLVTSLTASHAPVAGVTSLSDNAGYLAFRAGERQPGESLSGNTGYQVQRAGERASEPGTILSQDSGWQAQRAGERGATP